MAEKLMVVALGPVQDFIMAARRTRDLWFGSHLLSEISKAVALGLKVKGAELIFPYPQSLEELHKGTLFNATNKITVLLPKEAEPEDFAEFARNSAQGRWEEYCKKVLAEVEDNINAGLWKRQVRDALECYIAWVPILEYDYAAARERLELLLVGRKALRDFQSFLGGEGIPKSSLDGARESVIKQNNTVDRVRLQLKDKEQLDAIGLVKRLGGSRKAYPSVSRLAADPWLRGINRNNGLLEIRRCCARCAAQGLISRLETKVYEKYEYFPFDATFLYRFKELGVNIEAEEAVQDLQKASDRLFGKYKWPSPYLAILQADGDKMGETISRLQTVERHQELSRKLSQFVHEANNIVQQNYGALIYSGGDDVLALLPLDKCLIAATELREKFNELMLGFKEQQNKGPTLSVGIAIGHCLERMDDLLEMARNAEKDAKSPNRDGLAIHFRPRSGGDKTAVRQQWGNGLVTKLEKWTGLILSQNISGRTAYDLRKLYKDYKDWPESMIGMGLLRSDTLRVLEKKRPRGGILSDTVSELLANIEKPQDLLEMSKELILAEVLAQSKREAAGLCGKKREVGV